MGDHDQNLTTHKRSLNRPHLIELVLRYQNQEVHNKGKASRPDDCQEDACSDPKNGCIWRILSCLWLIIRVSESFSSVFKDNAEGIEDPGDRGDDGGKVVRPCAKAAMLG